MSEETNQSQVNSEFRAVIDLDSPIVSAGETIKQLKFKNLKGKAIRKLGYPFKMHSDGSFEIDGTKIATFIEEYCNLSPNASDQLSESDHFQAGMTIASFYMPSTE